MNNYHTNTHTNQDEKVNFKFAFTDIKTFSGSLKT